MVDAVAAFANELVRMGAFTRLASSRLIKKLPALTALIALGLMTSSAGSAVPPQENVTTSHGYAVFGGLKYGPDFKHLEYTNPDAPKGGIYHYAGGRSYDSLNQFALVGTFPWLMLFVYDPLMERSLDEPASYYGVIAKTITYPDDYSWVEFEMNPKARYYRRPLPRCPTRR